MKNTIKIVCLFIMGLYLTSCSKEEENIPLNDVDTNKFEQNVHADRFKGVEIGNSKYVLPQSNVDIHIEFDYEGTSKVSKIFFDAIPVNVPNIKEGQVAWELKNHLVPKERYEGQLNPHIHYHVYFDENDKRNPNIKPAEGVYKFKITIEHEDGSKSIITKDLKIVQKFQDLKVGNNKTITFGENVLNTEFTYNSGENVVEEIKYQLWFKEWREGKEKPIGKWNNIVEVLTENLYKGKKNPIISYDYALPKGLPKGEWWLNLYVKEKGESEAVKLSVPIKVL